LVTEESFADLPVDHIERMLDWLNTRERTQLESIGKLTALNAAYSVQGEITDLPSFLRGANPYENRRFIEEALKIIDPRTAIIFKAVAEKDKVPEWVWNHIRRDEIWAVATLDTPD